MSNHPDEDWSFAAIVATAVIGFLVLCFLIGLTTHASHVADLKYAHEEMVTCIQSDRPAADCRLIVYGSN